MVLPKFIIEIIDDKKCLIIGNISFHKHLAYDTKNIRGGGLWQRDENSFTLYGASHDFGIADLEDIKECVRNGDIYTNYTCTSSLSRFDFYYIKEDNEKIKL